MKIYSDYPAARTRQVITDLFALATIGAWVWLGATLYGLVMKLADFGIGMEEAGSGFSQSMKEIGDNLGGVPLIGGGIRSPFDAARGAGSALEQAGLSQQAAVSQLAIGIGVGIAALPVLTILLLWLIPRIRFSRRAGSVKRTIAAGAGIELLALRALASQKLPTLVALDADPMGAWRRGDEAVMRSLARLELKSSGVRLRD
ncbi:hypothetical protein BH09ACT3_BH09ACT3_02740 [soil metagenome]